MRSSKINQPALTDAEVSFVLDLAKQSGKLATEMREGVGIQEKTGPHDRVTEADLKLSSMITAGLKQHFPNDAIISEEDSVRATELTSERVWLVDPIDGTDNYIRNDSQWSVMIGLVVNQEPVFGCAYAGATETMYYGGPTCGSWRADRGSSPQRYTSVPGLEAKAVRRLMMGVRDRKNHPWVTELPEVQFIKSGSVGLKVAMILNDEADMFVHLSGKLKVWDTAAPVAFALAAGLEVGQLDGNGLPFELPKLQHECTVIIGRPGSLEWCRTTLSKPT